MEHLTDSFTYLSLPTPIRVATHGTLDKKHMYLVTKNQ